MPSASLIVVCPFTLVITLVADVSAEVPVKGVPATGEIESAKTIWPFELRPNYYPLDNHWRGESPPGFKLFSKIEITLYEAVISRIGLPYRWGGVDDRGYDCSGFVWRVFRDAGIEFDRMSARSLWEVLPEASSKERAKFGTLVFFNGLSHVGIVCNEDSFYHASSSQGVVHSSYTDYWGSRITGFRRALAPEKQEEIQNLDLDEDRNAGSRRTVPPVNTRNSEPDEPRPTRKGKKGM